MDFLDMLEHNTRCVGVSVNLCKLSIEEHTVFLSYFCMSRSWQAVFDVSNLGCHNFFFFFIRLGCPLEPSQKYISYAAIQQN